MRACQLVVVLLVVCLSSASALRCNRCIPLPPDFRCYNIVETCSRPDKVCVTVVITNPPSYQMTKRCMTRSEASRMMRQNRNVHVSTCSTDLCN